MSSNTILIVDDDQSICSILNKILSSEGYNVLEANTAHQSLKIFSEIEVDLVLLDLLLPDADGIELAQQMLSSKGQIPIILITAHGDIPKAVEATKKGVYDFFEKPFDRHRLLVTIRNALSWEQARKELFRQKEDYLKRYKMVGQSQAMQKVYAMIDRIAPTNAPVLILGENGVGKDLVAQAIHANSPRASKRMVKINCPAVPDTLLESELFGHTKGSFTGAYTSYTGRIQQANGSTLFLDEIADLSASAQAKLLRFLENGEIQRVGSGETVFVDARIIAASNKNLVELVAEGKFRQDLYYRLEVFPIIVPPLRTRRSDIPLLLNHFIEIYAEEKGLIRPRITPAAQRFLNSYDWPGNIRQLEHFVERMMILLNQEVIDIEHVRSLLKAHEKNHITESEDKTLSGARRNFEREHILTILAETNGNVAQAARTLGVDRANLYRKMAKLGIKG